MVTYRSGRRRLLGPATCVAVGVAAALAWGACRSRDAGRSPDAVFAEAERGHDCGRPGCSICDGIRRWVEANPGRRPGDLREAADWAPDAAVIFTGDLTEASEADIYP